MKKKFIYYVFVLLFSLSCFFTPASAYGSVIVSVNNEITVSLNGEQISFDQKPILKDNRTLVPMRAIFEAMGCTVNWYESNEEIDVWKDGVNVMTLWVGSTSMWLQNNVYITLDVAPIVMNDRTLVPVRAISESLGADVRWNDANKRVSITYYDDITPDSNITDTYPNTDITTECKHLNTYEANEIDLRKISDKGDSDKHLRTDTIAVICSDCRETLETYEKSSWDKHDFINDVCSICGYRKKSVTNNTNPSYDDNSDNIQANNNHSNELSDYINGAFMYINVPAGKTIQIPNTSNGSLKIQLDGTYNTMERKANATINVSSYNKKERKGTFSVAKGSVAVIENSGYSNLSVAIPAEYAQYSESYEQVYCTMSLSSGESISAYAKHKTDIYISSKDYEYVVYKSDEGSLSRYSITGPLSSPFYIYKNNSAIITATNNIDILYCPAVTDVSKTSQSASREIVLQNGETVRIRSTESSNSKIFTDGSHLYDVVVYNTNGKVVNQKQGSKYDYLNISAKQYADFTNVSGETVTIKVPSVYCTIE